MGCGVLEPPADAFAAAVAAARRADVAVVAVGGRSPRDTSRYDFGTKFAVMPEAGIRWYPVRRVSVRVDFRAVGWKVTYPATYKYPYNQTPVLEPTAPLSEWTWHPWVTLGLGWTF